MGMDCPRGHGRQNVVQLITADGTNATKMEQAMAYRLQCGCVVGGEQYEAFKAAVSEIEKTISDEIRNLNETARQQKAAVYQTYITGKKVN